MNKRFLSIFIIAIFFASNSLDSGLFSVTAQEVEEVKWVLVDIIINPYDYPPVTEETTPGLQGTKSSLALSETASSFNYHWVFDGVWVYDSIFRFTWDKPPDELQPGESIELSMTGEASWRLNETAYFNPAIWVIPRLVEGAYSAIGNQGTLIEEIGVEHDPDMLVGPPYWEITEPPSRWEKGELEFRETESKSFRLSVPQVVGLETIDETLTIYAGPSIPAVKWMYQPLVSRAPMQPMFLVDPTEGYPKSMILCKGNDFPPNAEVTLHWDKPEGTKLGEKDADADGNFAVLIEIPPDAVPDEYKIHAKSGSIVLSAVVLVKGKLPIIFIPGVAGSVLCEVGWTGLNYQLWPLAVFARRWNLELDPDGNPPNGVKIVATDIVRDVLKVKMIYGPFIEKMDSWGYYEEPWGREEEELLFVFPYDWRLDNLQNGDALGVLVEKVLEDRPEKKVVLIAHSMGGIVARAYLARHGGKKRVDTFITMGTPHLGSVKPYCALTMGYTFGNSLVNQQRMKIICQNLPSAYQLLPRREFIWQLTDGENRTWSFPETYSVWYHSTNWKRVGLTKDKYTISEDWPWTFNQRLLKEKEDLHDWIREEAPEGVDTYTIIGVGRATLSKYEARFPNESDEESHGFLKEENKPATRRCFKPKFGDGDGTVPLWSARGLKGDKKFFIPNDPPDESEHGYLPLNERVQELIYNILHGTVDENEYTYEKARAHESDWDWSDTEEFALFSSANLHIYDSEGRHMGLNDYGAVEEEIPGGTFLRMDDKEYAAIFYASDSYQVRVAGSETGEFTLVMNVSSGGETLDMVYPEVQVENGTEAVLEIPSVQAVLENPPTMTVTSNGDTMTVNPWITEAEVTDVTSKPQPSPTPSPQPSRARARVQEHLFCTSVDATGEPKNVVDEFSSDDGDVFSLLRISDAVEGDRVYWLFEGPNLLVVEAEITTDWAGEGSAWASFSLNDYKLKEIVGSWKVTVFINEEEALVDYFEVTEAESDGSIFIFILILVVVPGALIFWWRRRSRTRRKKAEPVTARPDYCVRCGARLDPLDEFCGECGNKIEN